MDTEAGAEAAGDAEAEEDAEASLKTGHREKTMLSPRENLDPPQPRPKQHQHQHRLPAVVTGKPPYEQPRIAAAITNNNSVKNIQTTIFL